MCGSEDPQLRRPASAPLMLLHGGAVGCSARHRRCCLDEVLEVDRCPSTDEQMNEQAKLEFNSQIWNGLPEDVTYHHQNSLISAFKMNVHTILKYNATIYGHRHSRKTF